MSAARRPATRPSPPRASSGSAASRGRWSARASAPRAFWEARAALLACLRACLRAQADQPRRGVAVGRSRAVLDEGIEGGFADLDAAAQPNGGNPTLAHDAAHLTLGDVQICGGLGKVEQRSAGRCQCSHIYYYARGAQIPFHGLLRRLRTSSTTVSARCLGLSARSVPPACQIRARSGGIQWSRLVSPTALCANGFGLSSQVRA